METQGKVKYEKEISYETRMTLSIPNTLLNYRLRNIGRYIHLKTHSNDNAEPVSYSKCSK